jgi:NADH-quinone oxidoreductase subunit N
MSLLPMIILGGGMLCTMLVVALRRSHILAFISTMLVLTASFTAIFLTHTQNPHVIGELFVIDSFGLYYQALILAATFIVSIFSYISLKNLFPDKKGRILSTADDRHSWFRDDGH